MEESKVKKVAKVAVSNIGYILTIVIVLGFVLSGLIIPGIKQTNIWLILVSSGLMLGLGITLNMILPIQALIDGEKHENVISAKQRVNETYVSIKDKTQYTDAYVDVKNRKALKQVITNKLRKELLEYDNHFNEDGTFKYDSFLVINEKDSEFIKAEKERKNKLLEELSKGLKITLITRADVLAQDEATDNDPNRRPETEKKFLVKQFRNNLITKVASAVFGGAFGATFAGLAVGDIIYRLIWSIILVAFAFLGYMKAYRYKTVDYVARLRQSAEWQEEMYNMIVSGELEAEFKERQKMLYGEIKEKEEIKNDII
jgi:hypothetical protein